MKNSVTQRSDSELTFGDVVIIKAPFEENTPDYYNGYSVIDVRGDYVRDKNGFTYKWRPVMVVGRGGGLLSYLTLTSSRTNQYDEIYQHHLVDNSMTPPTKRKVETFVELGTVRVIPSRKHFTYPYFGKITNVDKEAIVSKLNRLALSMYADHDKRSFVTPEIRHRMENILSERGYEQSGADPVLYKSQEHEIYFYKNGVVHYHKPIDLEDLRKIYAKESSTKGGVQP